MSRDRGFMVESMTALKKRNEQLVSELQQCKVWFYYICLRVSVRSQAQVAPLSFVISTYLANDLIVMAL